MFRTVRRPARLLAGHTINSVLAHIAAGNQPRLDGGAPLPPPPALPPPPPPAGRHRYLGGGSGSSSRAPRRLIKDEPGSSSAGARRPKSEPEELALPPEYESATIDHRGDSDPKEFPDQRAAERASREEAERQAEERRRLLCYASEAKVEAWQAAEAAKEEAKKVAPALVPVKQEPGFISSASTMTSASTSTLATTTATRG
ncbi:protein VASP homolog [Brachypodium distachyon]|uniref:protein VASP homolog n=1 Tax=Brachypodium distachyon TaxID=15368 RepID=UPI00052FF440|nr:protein VASP homolog [Brachypodium distachyon]|eukprot:XP_010233424.1 protein VASP homolog [Brachypodium distachyon]